MSGIEENKNILIKLSSVQQEKAIYIGTQRREIAKKRNRIEPHGHPTDALGKEKNLLELDISSSGAELAVSIFSKLKWNDELIEDALYNPPPDVGEDVQVRWSYHAKAHLIVYKDDRYDQKYVLVTGSFPEYNIVGWIDGYEAKTNKFWKKTPRGTWAYWINQNDLWGFAIIN